eukprot:CAMPEP_0178427688 /NCGR_PEP_ID=MMETSP0689_2-20121128/29875_1 /TAXON_ID=160604 /ORGANISM="Amphidinium massartii, Strain CS-259" /LENGTH=108 /DNA_ID=CAMNT_0020049405 /DNA_START=190 /DNA_END=517 /DNA_ORIENTATION=-
MTSSAPSTDLSPSRGLQKSSISLMSVRLSVSLTMTQEWPEIMATLKTMYRGSIAAAAAPGTCRRIATSEMQARVLRHIASLPEEQPRDHRIAPVLPKLRLHQIGQQRP